ncbi:MAG: hypothetical protein ACE5PV_07820 [Candidatus Poribacteria bacterium]
MMSYGDGEIVETEGDKIGLYAFNYQTKKWDYLSKTKDKASTKVIAEIDEVADKEAFYALLLKTDRPKAPILANIPSPTYFKLLDVNGFADADVQVEIFVNGVKQEDVRISKLNGTFTCRLILQAGENVITFPQNHNLHNLERH